MITRLGSIVSRRTTRLSLGAFALLMMAAMVFGFALPDAALAWDNCPKGVTNCEYPGRCGRYVDTNGDDICDLSQPKPVAATTTTDTVATSTTDTTSTTKVVAAAGSLTTTTAASGEPPTGDCPLGPCIGCRACVSISVDVETGAAIAYAGTAAIALSSSDSDGNGTGGTAGTGTSDTAIVADATGSSSAADVTARADSTTTSGGSSILTHYLVGPIALGFFLIYAVSSVLYKTKRIRMTTHRKIWNVMLLGTFLVTGLFGLILTIQLDYTLPFTIPINLLFWHVEAGIAMTLISLFHMAWHFSYYKNLVRNTRKRAREARAAERTAPRRAARQAPQRALVPDNVLAVEARELAPDGMFALKAREQRRAERETQRLREESDRMRRQAYPPASTRPWLEPSAD